MPSKKKTKARGKARRVTKPAKEGEEEKAANDEVKSGDGVLDSQMQRLQINNGSKDKQNDDDALLERAIKLAAAEKEELEAAAKNDEADNTVQCYHGFVVLTEGDVCGSFIQSFVDEFNAGREKTLSTLVGDFEHVYDATKTKYAEVWNDPDKLQFVASYFLYDGTKLILKGSDYHARCAAVVASFFEQSVKIRFHKTQHIMNWGKVGELFKGDENTLVSFFRKRVPCKCLDEKYHKVKSITKIGFCWNGTCSLPGHVAERSKMFYCTQCRQANYCSRECQVAAWNFHRKNCK
jgi:hypothetical protein